MNVFIYIVKRKMMRYPKRFTWRGFLPLNMRPKERRFCAAKSFQSWQN